MYTQYEIKIVVKSVVTTVLMTAISREQAKKLVARYGYLLAE